MKRLSLNLFLRIVRRNFFIFEGNYSPVLATIRNKGLNLSVDKLIYFLYCMFSYQCQIMAYFTVELLSGFIF